VQLLYVMDSVMKPGGAEQSLALLAPEYRGLGVQLDVATLFERPGHQDALRAAGARLFPIGGSRGRFGDLQRVRRLIHDLRPDLVHTTLYQADIVGRIAAATTRTPVVSSLVNLAYGPEHFADPSAPTWRLRAAQGLDVATARLTVRMHAVSARVADVMAPRLLYPRSRVDVVVRGRDAATLGTREPARRARARAMLGVDEPDQLVLAVAREEHQKGLDVLLESVAGLRAEAPAARVFIAARRGAQSDVLAAMVERLDLGRMVTFLGTRDDVADLLCAADVFVLPSRREGLPGAVVEAMAMQVPIVASDLPEVREVVDDSTAILVPPESPERLARAIASVLRDRNAAASRAEAARQRFLEHFTVQNTARQMVEFYERALAAAR